MSFVAQEIASQPACWQIAVDRAAAATEALPRKGERVCISGCGTSHNIAKVYAQLRERAGMGETDAFASSEMPEARIYDRGLFVSRTGTTTETLDALRRTRSGVPTVALVAGLDTPLANEAGAIVPFDFADEQAVVQTRFATSVIVLLRAHLGDEIVPMLEAANWGLETALPDGAMEARQHVFLGRGWTAGLADEAALKLRETAQVWAESHNAMEYRHGPMSVAEAGSLVWCFGEPPTGMAKEIAVTGATWESVGSVVDPLGDLVRAQRLAVALAEARERTLIILVT